MMIEEQSNASTLIDILHLPIAFIKKVDCEEHRQRRSNQANLPLFTQCVYLNGMEGFS